MKKYKKSILLSILVFSFVLTTFAAENVDFSIRFHDTQVYYPDSDIYIQVRIINNSSAVYRFNLADNRFHNIDFNVKTLTNLPVKRSDQFITLRTTNQHVFYREISLRPGEEHGFVINLSDYIDFPAPGVYIVEGIFLPELRGQEKLTSNRLNLSIRPPVREVPEVFDRIDLETGEILKRTALPPDEVVRYTIQARQQSAWQKFFLYIDATSLMLRNPRIEMEYRRASEEQRQRMISEYEEKLRNEMVDQDILQRPSTFEIIKTSYTTREATVLVDKRFRYPEFTELKRYTYHLERKDRYWTIVNYDVRNLGTE